MTKQKSESIIKTAYFTASHRSEDKNGRSYEDIASVLTKLNINTYDKATTITNTDLQKMGKDKLEEYYKESLRQLKSADVFIAEVSTSSSTIGYEIALAIESAKPTLLLRSETIESLPGAPLVANPSKLITFSYYNEKTLESKIKTFLRKAEKGIFVKRLPIEFTQAQVEYVQYCQGIGARRSFNATVRQIIDEALSKDKTYKDFRSLEEE